MRLINLYTSVLFLTSLKPICANKKLLVLESTLNESVHFPIIGATLQNPVRRKVNALTICARFNYKILGGSGSKSGRLVSISDWQYSFDKEPDFQLFSLPIAAPLSFFMFGYPMTLESYASWLIKDMDRNTYLIWTPKKWNHVCFAYDGEKNASQMIIDGYRTNIKGYDSHLVQTDIPEDFLMNNRTSLGRCNWVHRYPCSDHYGKITDFNIWDKAMSEAEMISWTTCKTMTKGNLVNWSKAKWFLFNMTIVEYDTESICKPIKPGHVIMPEKRNLTSSVAMCQKFKGQHSVIKNQETQNELMNKFRNFDQCRTSANLQSFGFFFGGWWDQPTEGIYTNVNNGDAISNYQPWFPGEPNGGVKENCQVVWPSRNAWNDAPCNSEACSFCFLPNSPQFQMKGFCLLTRFDTSYGWTGEMLNGHYRFYGYARSHIYWDDFNNEWRLEMYKADTPYATCNDTKDYPLGVHKWTVFNERCYKNENETVIINMNACTEHEFNCNDGTCIGIAERCDGRVNCLDKSDEIDCKMIQIDESYLKEVPAPPITDSSVFTDVFVGMEILEILEISEVNSFITFQLNLHLTWYDARLTFINLKLDENLNTLKSLDKDTIWIPSIIFYNTEDKFPSLNDYKAFAHIRRLGNFSASDTSDIENSLVFKGRDNPITISRVYSTSFICKFDMGNYPFDSQICFIHITMNGNSGNFVKLLADKFEYQGPMDLAQYYIKDTKFDGNNQVQNNGVYVKILFGRRVLSHFLTTYLPTTLICVICFSTASYKPFFFEAIVTVNLTALLVLTTMYISVSNGLPKTAYIKFIDIWAIVNIFVPFAEVLLLTLVDRLQEEEENALNSNQHQNQQNTNDKTKVRIISKTTSMDNNFENKWVMDENKGHMRENRGKLNLNIRKLSIIQILVKKGMPTIFFLFAMIYFAWGLSLYNKDFSDFK